MELLALLAAAVALAPERLCYAWIARLPHSFRAWCQRTRIARREPVLVVRRLFYGFKLLQLSVFGCWWLARNPDGLALSPDDAALVAGVALLAAGQMLNVSVFYRLGATGVFYGDRLGYPVPWCRDFPFSLMAHPQYVGAVLSIWGLFLALGFSHDDWFAIPALETVYYAIGARLEKTHGEHGPDERDRLVDHSRLRPSSAATL